jgi:hypothetical protein
MPAEKQRGFSWSGKSLSWAQMAGSIPRVTAALFSCLGG